MPAEVVETENSINKKRLRKSYDRLCRLTLGKTKALDINSDIKTIKDAFAAVKEGVNIGLLLDEEDGGADTIRVIFEGESMEAGQ